MTNFIRIKVRVLSEDYVKDLLQHADCSEGKNRFFNYMFFNIALSVELLVCAEKEAQKGVRDALAAFIRIFCLQFFIRW